MDKKPQKSCKVCGSILINRDGKMRGKQRYKCKNCGHVFQNKSRKKKQEQDFIGELWNKYCFKRQTYENLSEEYKISVRKIQCLLDQYEFIPPQITPNSIVLIMDTTYFGDIGVMVFKDSKSKKVLNYQLVKNETNDVYRKGVQELVEQGWEIEAVVCDGKRGLLKSFMRWHSDSDVPFSSGSYSQEVHY